MGKLENTNNKTEIQIKSDVASLLQLCQELEQSGKIKNALQILRLWLVENANSSTAFAIWYEFGRLLQLSKEYSKAQSAFQAALEQRPLFFEATLALGKSLESQGKKKEAIETWLAVVVDDYLQIETLNNIARLQEDTNDFVSIENTLLKSLKLNSEQDAVITTLLQVRQKLCRWPVISPDLPVSISRQEESIGPLMSLALYDDPEKNFKAAASFLESKQITTKSMPEHVPADSKRERIHVGFLSADFRLHATSVFFAPLIQHYDRQRFKVSILDITTTADVFPEFRNKLIGSADNYLPLQGLNDHEAIQLCRSIELDVLVDLGGLTSGARPKLVSERIAPVQIGYIGFLASTAIPNLDYIISTKDLFPEDGKGFSEKPLYLDGPYLVIDRDPMIASEISRSTLNISEETFIFGALLNTYKIREEVFEAWMSILKLVPKSIIWLIEDNKIAKENLQFQATKAGIDPARLLFSSRVHPAIFRNQLKLCDLFLDAFPYGSGATARDAIHADLPILSKPGTTMMSRLSSHLMRNLGLGELVSESIDDYIDKAIKIGNDKNLASQLRKKIQKSKVDADLYNARKFVDDFFQKIDFVVNQINSK